MAFLMLFLVLAIVISLLFLVTWLQRLPPPTASKPSEMSWYALQDDELQSYLPNQKISAIKRYRELTGVGLKEAKETIEYIIANPDAKGKLPVYSDTGGAGVQDLIAEGRLDEAIDVYAKFMGVDKFTAREAIEAMSDDQRHHRLVDDYDEDVIIDDDESILGSMGNK